MKAEGLSTGTQNGGAENVGRHEVGGGLHALEAEASETAQGFDDQRFCNAGHTFKQGVALAQDSDQHLLDGLALAGDYAAQFRARVCD